MAYLVELKVIGYMGKDPDFKTSNDGTLYCNFSVGATKRTKNREGQESEKTTWVNATAWGYLAESVQKLAKMGGMTKGALVYISGEPDLREYTDRNDRDRVSLDMKVLQFQLLHNKNSDRNNDQGEFNMPVRDQQTTPAAAAPKFVPIDF